MHSELAQQWAQRIFGTPDAMALGVLSMLIALLLAAAWTDLRRQIIPNWLVLAGTLLALLLHTLLPAGDGFLSRLPGGLGFTGSLAGLACGLLAFLPLYVLRAMGAGDIKLLAMIGAYLGPLDIWWALLFTLLAGGALAIGVALQRGVLGSVLHNLRLVFWDAFFAISTRGSERKDVPGPAFVSAARLPYGVAIAAGSIAWVIYRARLFGLF